MKLIRHSHHIVIVHAADQAELFDPITGHKQVFTSQRAAKWSASVYARIRRGFGHDVADDVQLELFASTINKPKE